MGVQLRYNFRVYPAPGQQIALARAFGCARVVYNDALAARMEAFDKGARLSDADRWYPSTSTCSACGVRGEKKPLHVRGWTCVCGITHDRDLNAAMNIFAAGRAGK